MMVEQGGQMQAMMVGHDGLSPSKWRVHRTSEMEYANVQDMQSERVAAEAREEAKKKV